MPVGIMASYKHCPLKKRPVFIEEEAAPTVVIEAAVIASEEQYEPENLCTKPQDLSVKRQKLSAEDLSVNVKLNASPIHDDEPQDYCMKYEYKRQRLSGERSISPKKELYEPSQISPAEYQPEYTIKHDVAQEVAQRPENWPYMQAESDWNSNNYYDPNHLEKSHRLASSPHDQTSASPPLGYHAFMPPQSTTHDYRRGKSDYYVNNNHRYLPYNNVAHLRQANQSQLSPTYSYASYGSVESQRESISPSSISSSHGDPGYTVSVLNERTSTSDENTIPHNHHHHHHHHHQPQSQNQHPRTVDSAPRFKCENCAKCYSTSVGLSKHQQFHCPAAEGHVKKVFSCKSCDKVYTSLGALKMHIRTHTLPCKCPICGKAFSRPWLLQGHIRTHTGEKPFKCDYCDRAFADRSNLRAHLQTHADIKKYQCNVCMKSFSRMSLLSKHSHNCTVQLHG